MAEEELPYKAEYSKSSRASCKTCKGKIEKDVLRLAAMVQSAMFDGKVPNWYHYKCFFVKQRPSTVADITNFDELRYEDQEKIKQKIADAATGGGGTPAKKGKGKGKGKVVASGEFKEFSVEVAKSSRAGCRHCELTILKGEVRISKLDYTSDSARRYGPMPRWHHITCFLAARDELAFHGAAAALPGFYGLPADMQDDLKTKILPCKRKAEDTVDSAPMKKVKSEDDGVAKRQNKMLFSFRDKLAALKKSELTVLLEENNFQSRGDGESIMRDRISDYMVFGAPERCDVCKNGDFVFKSGSGGYACTGDLTEWTRCTNVSTAPQRHAFNIPAALAEAHAFLGSYEKAPLLGEVRHCQYHGPSSAAAAATQQQQNGVSTSASKVSVALRRPLGGLSFVVAKAAEFSVPKEAVADQVKRLGGAVTKTITKTTAALIATAELVKKSNNSECDGKEGKDTTLARAEAVGVQVVDESFLEAVVGATRPEVFAAVNKHVLQSWGSDVEARVASSKLYKSSSVSKGGSRFTKSVPDTLTLTLKDGAAVDPDSGLQDTAHVLRQAGRLYTSVLGFVDVVKGTNSYYRLQLLENDKRSRWWVFRSWGRIGTTIGGNKLQEADDRVEAVRDFKALFEEKTGNRFTAEKFTKVAGYWQLLDVTYGEDSDAGIQKPLVASSSSSLQLSVQELVALLFDVDTMKAAMMEFKLDLKKLPLGALSKRQLREAYGALAAAQNLLEAEDVKGLAAQLLYCSNRFYTLLPHDFGMDKIPLLDSLELIKTKIQMVENLSEIEVAYTLLKDDKTSEGKNEEDPIDKHYKKLNTSIEEVDRTSEEFKMLQRYVTNTHADTHSHYSLDILHAFRVDRNGEAKRFKPFRKLHNHKLLWHGSRLTNFASILSQGLRIAPPEAPATGYMFGKGIYFADMVSKSANYCATSSASPTGLLLLCDVALGNMYECTSAEYVTKLAGGLHSTKGCGRTAPDPTQCETLNGVEVPLGKPHTAESSSNNTPSNLLYNEYIVYDVAQVQAKYLLKMNFHYTL